MTKKILAVGCSMTFGTGLEGDINDPKLWVNQIMSPIGKVHNLAKTGRNNSWICHEALSALVKESYDIVLIGWSAIPRYGFHAGLELYSTHTRLTNEYNINLNNKVCFPKKWLGRLGDDLRKMHNDHWDILDLVKYVNILIRFQETSPEKKIFFVNTLSPWCKGYFDYKHISFPSDLTAYEQDLLQVETRDDDEIFALYEMIHRDYNHYGGINEAHWLNLYDSLASMQVDDASKSDRHPGYKSQDRYAEFFMPIVRQKLGLI